ncbi:aldo/keto reductase [Rhizomonospora bruguierae]|uniref:aldo/keto reductase n=1 Tax=Rhizomonospora bruguierae TaxID=1581705 RepID=UPI001BCE1DE1|nr:aldo/keto reductase [Micromonospora sp. NBRC 107566]
MDPFERARLGRTEVTVTRLGLGLAPIGGLYAAVGDEAARATVRRAYDLGIGHFDTAPLYGSGLSERRAGSVLSTLPRDGFTLATKVGRRLAAAGGDGQDFWAEDSGERPVWDFSAEGTRRSYAESLERLGLERADVLHIHDPDDHFVDAMAGARPALVDLRAEGRIGAVSAGMNQSAMLADFVRTGDFDCVLLAGRYTLLDQSGLAGLLPLCAERGTSVICGGVYNSGILADPGAGARYNYAPAPASLVERALAMRAVCERHGVPLRAAAIQFPFGHPAVAGVVIGARSPAEVDDAVAMCSVEIPGALWADLRATGLIPDGVPVP